MTTGRTRGTDAFEDGDQLRGSAPQETVSRYGSLLGRAMRHLPYYEVFAAFRFCLITSRLTRLMAGTGMQRPDNESPYARSTALLDRLLAETDACVRQGGTTVT